MLNNGLDLLTKQQLDEIRSRLRLTKVNVLLVGGTGVGKSSTINALFQSAGLDVQAKVGETSRPETMDINQYKLGDNLVVWDSPGLGDSREKDIDHKESIKKLLFKKDARGVPLVDLVFLILDGSSRDFSSVYTLLKDVIIPSLDHNEKDRILIGINKADQAMSGHFWDRTKNRPEEKLTKFLEDQSEEVKRRINGLDPDLNVDPIFYSAGYTFDGELISRPYNLEKLLSYIMLCLPRKKRAVVSEYINESSLKNSFHLYHAGFPAI